MTSTRRGVATIDILYTIDERVRCAVARYDIAAGRGLIRSIGQTGAGLTLALLSYIDR